MRRYKNDFQYLVVLVGKSETGAGGKRYVLQYSMMVMYVCLYLATYINEK